MPTFDTPSAISAVIEVEVGELRITAGDRSDTVVTVVPSDPTREADVRAAQTARVDLAQDRLHVTGPRPGVVAKVRNTVGSIALTVDLPSGSAVEATLGAGGIIGSGRFGASRLRTGIGEIRVEHAAALSARTGMGAVTVGRADGDAEVSTGSGTIRVAEIGGNAQVKSSNGEVWVGRCDGELRAKSSNGTVSVDRAGADLTAKTANGDLRIGSVERGEVDLRTAAGRISVGIREGSAARLDVHTAFGTVINELTVSDGPAATDATVAVRAATGAGDIAIHRAAQTA